ncbi:regulatory protein RecX [Erythrobacter sp. EC-HK427]|uniref:regulatory protein RecX n=1 Tax=Erythrobacter sp. EC-HK427 TaxID=2038396 RepID=UPI0012541D1B|nr:RecX family transcriptional regulator [Erythrobacter sp. EC-HK427]VVT06485.1 Regulatory protein RecX [Erythrobacter sp. EC-HK427]
MDGNRHKRKTERRPKKPLSPAQLHDLALSYAARYATSAAKLERYLQRKLYERGWDEAAGSTPPDVAGLVADFVAKGYVDDEAYARMRAGDLLRRGYGGARVNQALGQAGIGEQVREDVAPGEAEKRRAALHLAQKRRFGPFASQPVDREKREKAIAAMLRAGHTFDHARAVIDAETEDQARRWLAEAEDWDDDSSL